MSKKTLTLYTIKMSTGGRIYFGAYKIKHLAEAMFRAINISKTAIKDDRCAGVKEEDITFELLSHVRGDFFQNEIVEKVYSLKEAELITDLLTKEQKKEMLKRFQQDL